MVTSLQTQANDLRVATLSFSMVLLSLSPCVPMTLTLGYSCVNVGKLPVFVALTNAVYPAINICAKQAGERGSQKMLIDCYIHPAWYHSNPYFHL